MCGNGLLVELPADHRAIGGSSLLLGGRLHGHITVSHRHGGGWSKKINAWYLNTLMVYL